MPIPGFKPKYLSPESTGIVPLHVWLYVNTHNDLHCMQCHTFAAGLVLFNFKLSRHVGVFGQYISGVNYYNEEE
jgi:hypothetical protein